MTAPEPVPEIAPETAREMSLPQPPKQVASTTPTATRTNAPGFARLPGFALLDTPIGRCGVSWSARGITGLQLPEPNDAETRARVRARCPEAREAVPPPTVQRAIDALRALLRGEPRDLSGVALDMSGVPAFHRRVYEAARAIPPGATVSYGEIAARLGEPGAARAVGQALGRNPFAIVVPCHRVLAADGTLGGFSANGGRDTKRRLLAIEGVPGTALLPLFDGDGRYDFDPAAAVAHLRAADPTLGRLVEAVGPFRLELRRARSLFGALAEAIVYQQLTAKAAATIYGRVCARLACTPEAGPAPERVLAAADDDLRTAGLSRSKLLALRDLAAKTGDGTLPTLAEARDLDDAALVERLTRVHGIGRWTVEMLLIFRLGRPDVLPADDYGIRKGFALTYGTSALPSPTALAAHGERWRPYRTVASWYLWRAAERGGR